MSRVPEVEFAGRDAELAAIRNLASITETRSPSIALLIGPARAGKTEILRKTFDRLFDEKGDVVPIFYSLRRSGLAPHELAFEYAAQFLSQLIAFMRDDPALISIADEPFASFARAAPAEDYAWMKSLVDSLAQTSKSDAGPAELRRVLAAPFSAALKWNVRPLVMIDNFHLLADSELHAEFSRHLAEQPAAAFILSGAERIIPELISREDGLFASLNIIRVGKLNEDLMEALVRRWTDVAGVEASDSTIELMIQQLDRDFFYARAVVDAAATAGLPLKTFVAFERLYTAEITGGRIAHYCDAVMRDAVSNPNARRAALEALALVNESSDPLPIETVVARVAEFTSDAEAVLIGLHSRELLEMSCGFVRASGDPVLADYVRAKYRNEIAGARRPLVGDELLGEKLKQSYDLMMSRYNRQVQAQLVELLSHFDYQSVPISLFDHAKYDQHYHGLGRAVVRQALEDELERVTLPQIVVVRDAGSGEQRGASWRLFDATGFEDGIYADANETLWLVALINAKEPLDVETLRRIDQQLDAALRGHKARLAGGPRAVRWYISKSGFSAVASELLSTLQAYRSTYSHIDLMQDYLNRLALGSDERRASEFELVIPVEDEAELIAARTAEQIARAADFDSEAINQIKTALIEACINAAEHSDSPDKKIHQRFAIDGDKLIITVSNRGKRFGRANGQSTPTVAASAKSKRGRGLQIIRALMDDVKFERTDDGTRLVMVKYLKRPNNK